MTGILFCMAFLVLNTPLCWAVGYQSASGVAELRVTICDDLCTAHPLDLSAEATSEIRSGGGGAHQAVGGRWQQRLVRVERPTACSKRQAGCVTSALPVGIVL